MITYIDAIFLGIIQGLSEFLPISSTAHLRLFRAFTFSDDIGAAYSAVIQLGTWVALLIYFRKDIKSIILDIFFAFFRPHHKGYYCNQTLRGKKTATYVIIATLPISIFGLLLSPWIHGPLRSLEIVATSLIVIGIWILIADLKNSQSKNLSQITWKSALYIGLAQALALIPGSSRSGTCLAMAFVLQFNRSTALYFSFLLSIPAIGLAGFYELLTQFSSLQSNNGGILALLISTLVSGVSGYFCIYFLFKFIKKHSMLVFSLYRITLGVFVFIWLYWL